MRGGGVDPRLAGWSVCVAGKQVLSTRLFSA